MEVSPVEMTPAQRIRAEAKEATRRALLESGLLETIENGGSIPSIESVCARAGYTRGAFYVYFRDREHYVNEMLAWVLSDIISALFDTTAAGATDIAEVIERFGSYLDTGDWPALQSNIRAGYLAVLREVLPGTPVQQQHAELMLGIRDRMAELIRESQREGGVRGDIDAGDLAMLALVQAIGSILWNGIGILEQPAATTRSFLKLLMNPA